MKKRRIEIPFSTQEEWVKNRETFIGGSESAAIMGLSKWATPFSVWEQKTGKADPWEDNTTTLRGKFLEDGIAKYFEHESGYKVIQGSSKQTTYRFAEYPFMGGSVDRRVWLSDGSKAILEIKTTKQIINVEDIPLSWYVQPNQYCYLYGYKKFIICWFEMFSDEIKWHEFDFDQSIFDATVASDKFFWEEYVLKNIPPPAVSEEDIKKLFPNHMEGKQIVANEEALEIYSKAIEAKRQAKIINSEYDDLKTKIKIIMGDNEYLMSPLDDVLATFRTGAKSRTLNIKEI